MVCSTAAAVHGLCTSPAGSGDHRPRPESQKEGGCGQMSYQDKTLTCVDCGNEFAFTANEQAFYADRGFTNEPKRCPNCRQSRKANRGSGYSSGYEGGSGYGSGDGGNQRGGGGYGGQREMHVTT